MTLDAMGRPRDIRSQIIEKGGDYVISLQGNQGSLQEDIKLWFEDNAKPVDHV